MKTKQFEKGDLVLFQVHCILGVIITAKSNYIEADCGNFKVFGWLRDGYPIHLIEKGAFK